MLWATIDALLVAKFHKVIPENCAIVKRLNHFCKSEAWCEPQQISRRMSLYDSGGKRSQRIYLQLVKKFVSHNFSKLESVLMFPKKVLRDIFHGVLLFKSYSNVLDYLRIVERCRLLEMNDIVLVLQIYSAVNENSIYLKDRLCLKLLNTGCQCVHHISIKISEWFKFD